MPAGTTAVIVAGPRSRFLAEEVESLTRYVEGGGRLLLLLDPVQDASDDGLDVLLQRFGVRRLAGTVLSQGHHMRSAFNKADRSLVYSNTFTSHPSVSSASRNSLQVAALLTRGAAFERTAKVPPGVLVSFPMRSSPDFWRDLDADLDLGPREALAALNLMVAVRVTNLAPPTGVPSQAGTAPLAKQAAANGEATAPEGRIVIIGDGDFATDALIKSDGNALVFVDSLRWLIGEQKVTGDLSSEEDVPIEHRKDTDRLWFYATTFAVPLPLLLLGLWIGRRRRSGGR